MEDTENGPRNTRQRDRKDTVPSHSGDGAAGDGTPDPAHDITIILQEANNGSEAARALLWRLVYDELRTMAHNFMRRERQDHTLSGTELVHALYLNLGGRDIEWKNRKQFYGYAARAMRNYLVDYARTYRSQRNNGGIRPDGFDEQLHRGTILEGRDPAFWIDLDRSMRKLEAHNPVWCQVVELMCFAGFPADVVAEIIGKNKRTVERYLRWARNWLHNDMYGDGGAG